MSSLRVTLVAVALVACACAAPACSKFGEDDAGSAALDGGSDDAASALDADAAADGAAADLCTGGCPVAAYDFDEATGDAILDRSGNGNHGTLVTATRIAGQVGRALSFEKASAGTAPVLVPGSPSLDVKGTHISLALWLWVELPTDLKDDQVILAKPWAENAMPLPWYQYGMEFDVNGAHTVEFFMGDAVSDAAVTAPVTVPFSRWFHLAFTYDGANIRAYLDGSPAGVTPAVLQLTARGTGLRLGCDALAAQPFLGKMDELRIYDRTLSAPEIQTLAHR